MPTQLFVNLAENAINHCPLGTRIIMSLADDGDRALASVSDNDSGIPAHERGMAFQRFDRLDKKQDDAGKRPRPELNPRYCRFLRGFMDPIRQRARLACHARNN
ncbi:sensor histidine kinase [Rhizobium sp. NPDC092011]|uniref:ATP-binding protein n=1 Tax=Rhizobium sp. NPDC092011 TaxID=3364500 RepID=UPI0037FDA284